MKDYRRNTPSALQKQQGFMPLKDSYWDALCLFAAQFQRNEGDTVLKRCSRCVTELISLTESTLCAFFYCSVKLTAIFHVHLLWERGHKRTSVHRRHRCLSVTPQPTHVFQLDTLCGWVTLIPIGISEVQEKREGKHKDLSLKRE